MERDDSRRAAGALCIDHRTRSVVYRGAPVELTATEFRILELLNSHPGWVFSAGNIADHCLESGGSDESIIVHISNVRAKLAQAAGEPTPVETVRGFGYRLSRDSSEVFSSTEFAGSSEALGDELLVTGSLCDAAAAYVRAIESANDAEPVPLARLHMKAAQVAIDRRLLMEATGHSADAEKILRAGDVDANQEMLNDLLVQRTWLTYYMGDYQSAYGRCVELLRGIEHSGTPQQRMKLHGCALMSLLGLNRFVVTSEVLKHAWLMYDAWGDSGDLADAVYTESLLGATLLYSGNITAGEQRLSDGLRMSEKLGERSMRPQILGSMGIAARRRGEVRLAERLGTQLVCETAERERAEFEGEGHGLLCWAAWRDGDLDRASDQGQAALRGVQLMPMFPFWWLALAPLIAIALNQGNLGDAIGYARHMLDPSQQMLPASFNDALAAACAAWDAGGDAEARGQLAQAVLAGRAGGYT